MKAGLLFNKAAWWVGVHYSPYNQRFCINVIPWLTIWVTRSGGTVPMKAAL